LFLSFLLLKETRSCYSVFAQLALTLCAAFVLNACALVPEPPPAETPVPASISGQPQPAIISGLLRYTNDIFTSYATHHAVALVDLQGFVRRDADWEIPADSLAFGSRKLDEREQADPMALPIEYYILDSGLGHVRINSNDDDLDLINELFIRALDSFDYHEVPGVIVDLRQNDGGAPLYLADYMSKQAIALGQWEYYSEVSSRFEAEGPRDQVDPVDQPYLVEKLAVLVDQSCFSACEVEAYGFSKLPGAIVVGQYPSAGVVADVARGQYWLPEEIDFQVSTGRYVLPDGALLIEGSGVVPTLDVPVDQRIAVADEDVVLRAAEQALLKQ
jgi:hypothetical protein